MSHIDEYPGSCMRRSKIILMTKSLMVGLENRIWIIQALWYVFEEKPTVWDFVLTTGSLISEQYQLENPELSIFWTNYGGQCWFTTLDMSKIYHQGYIHKNGQIYCFFDTFFPLQMTKNTIWINKCFILFSKVHK